MPKRIIAMIFVIAALTVATAAQAQNVKTFKSNFPNFCPNPGPTAY